MGIRPKRDNNTNQHLARFGPLLGISYEPQTDRWRELPPAPVGRAVPDIDRVDDRILAWSYDPETDGIAALDTDTLQWQELPAFPGRPSDGIPTAAAIGPKEAMMATESFMAIYSEESNQWRITPTPTADIGPLTPSAWTGTEALFLSNGLPPGDPNALTEWRHGFGPTTHRTDDWCDVFRSSPSTSEQAPVQEVPIRDSFRYERFRPGSSICVPVRRR